MAAIRLITVKELKRAYYLAKDIYTVDGRILLLRKGTKMDSNYQERLIQLGFHSVFVNDKIDEDIQPSEVLKPSLRYQANKMVFEIINREELVENRRKIADLRLLVRDMISEVVENDVNITIDMPEIKTFSNYVYLHSVNVAVLGILIGKDLGFTEEDLEHYAIGALLHDIGKIEIPDSIIGKEGPLTKEEFAIMKQHTRKGFNLLNSKAPITESSYVIALQHHEAYDGTGYPDGRFGEDIEEFSRVAAVVDIFDALTSDRPYKKRWSFYNTLSHLSNGVKSKLDPKALEIFLKRVPPYPLGSTVRLSTGEIGIISRNNKDDLTRPTVRVIKDIDGNDIPEDLLFEVDLTENLGTSIISHMQHQPV